ncbi:efflux RND transporter permease subunit [Aliamphritea spongicola]|uniref:efflux RND transporter permease subunit n=1 Tax=Aliamphritea spongicola TaxID=707589 RepID=UPI00196B1C55|nr:efflux RND transporter permease subunit [Aliamphritea spongicola]MBN3562523.1 efflux RND transporter permease subunit [Aliamphritea spongicola]
MQTAVRWFIYNPVAANLMMAFIVFVGVMTTLTIRIEGFPRIPPESVLISTDWSGATVAQVDELVTRKIEQSLEGLPGVRSISSESANGSSFITVGKAGGQDLQQLLDKVRLRIDGVQDLPEKAKRPVIETDGFDIPALYINLYGDTDLATLQTLSERLKENLQAREEISRLTTWGIQPREIRIEIQPQRIRQLELTLADVTAKIRASSLDFRAGTLRTRDGTLYLRTDNRARFSHQFATIPIIERPDGSQILLGDIADIQDTFLEGDFLFRFNNAPTTGMEILVGKKENLLEISAVVHEVIDAFQPQLPANVDITVWGDSSEYIADRLELLKTNGVQGLLLVVLMLSVFLKVRLAFWVAMGIPISVMGALAVAGTGWVDYSLNDITTFGLIIALGILVDDAVVVGESVFEERLKHKDAYAGTEAGVEKVAVATVFGILTTIAAFVPMLLMDNPLGKVLAGFSGIVILALIFSLIESKFILPAHLAHLNLDSHPPRFLLARLWRRIQQTARRGLLGIRDHIYAPLLKHALRQRYAVLVMFITAGTLGLGMLYMGKVRTVFFPDVPGQLIRVNLVMDARAPFRLTRQHIEHIQATGEALNQHLQQQAGLEKPPIRSMFLIAPNAKSAQIFAELTPTADRPTLGVLDIARQWRENTGQLEGSTELIFAGSEDIAGGFQIRLQSKDTQQLAAASQELQIYLAGIAGVSELRDSLVTGQPELEISLRPEARTLGFTSESLATQIGYAFGGTEVQKLRRDSNEIRVLIQNARADRDTLDDLLQTRLRSSTGAWIPLHAVAEFKGTYVAGTLHRRNGKRTNTVSAAIDRSQTSPEEIGQAIFGEYAKRLQARYPGVEILPAGELEEMGGIRKNLIKALILAAVLIYILMAVPLKSYWQPFIIMSIVPFGFIGAAMGHMIMDLPLSLLSFFGMLALTGVVVNDSLVMMTRYNDARRNGMDISDALQDAGTGRFNAIFLTTATTVIGLVPLLSETSEQAQYLIPAAASLAYGELFATALMLILVPVLIAIAEDIKSLWYRLFTFGNETAYNDDP